MKSDAVDLEAITELVLSGQGSAVSDRAVVLGELAAWVRHRSRRVMARSGLKNQLLGQLDRAFPGLTLALPDVLASKVGRMVVEHFTDPGRLAALGETRFIRFAATRGLAVRQPVAVRVVAAARDALPTADAVVARRMVANDLHMLQILDRQVAAAEDELAALLPGTPIPCAAGAGRSVAEYLVLSHSAEAADTLCDAYRAPPPGVVCLDDRGARAYVRRLQPSDPNGYPALGADLELLDGREGPLRDRPCRG